jgi:heme/copper-type cytochrome/quinol oxidase subunit 3
VTTSPALDVGELPTHGHGTRDPVWLGMALMILIELTSFAMMVGAYFYVRMQYVEFPPTAYGASSLRSGAGVAALMIVELPLAFFLERRARAEDLRGVRRWLSAVVVVAAVAVALRAFEITRLGFRWDSHAYGSVFWALIVGHTFHLVTDLAESAMILALAIEGPFEAKNFVDVETTALYWYFVAGSWPPLFAILYLEAVVLR